MSDFSKIWDNREAFHTKFKSYLVYALKNFLTGRINFYKLHIAEGEFLLKLNKKMVGVLDKSNAPNFFVYRQDKVIEMLTKSITKEKKQLKDALDQLNIIDNILKEDITINQKDKDLADNKICALCNEKSCCYDHLLTHLTKDHAKTFRME